MFCSEPRPDNPDTEYLLLADVAIVGRLGGIGGGAPLLLTTGTRVLSTKTGGVFVPCVEPAFSEVVEDCVVADEPFVLWEARLLDSPEDVAKVAFDRLLRLPKNLGDISAVRSS